MSCNAFGAAEAVHPGRPSAWTGTVEPSRQVCLVSQANHGLVFGAVDLSSGSRRNAGIKRSRNTTGRAVPKIRHRRSGNKHEQTDPQPRGAHQHLRKVPLQSTIEHVGKRQQCPAAGVSALVGRVFQVALFEWSRRSRLVTK